MSKTLLEVKDEVLHRLGDTVEKVWTGTEIESYLKEGYEEIAILTRCFWDQYSLEDLPFTGNYVGTWEKDCLTPGEVPYGRFTHTNKWEKDYDTEGLDPANHTSYWEKDYTTVDYISALDNVPESLYQIERAIWNNRRVEMLTAHQLAADPNYETTEGDVCAYSLEHDGARTIRKYRKPSAKSDEYAVTGTWGTLRTPSDLSGDIPTGTWGVMRRCTSQSVSTSYYGWGLPRRVSKSTRVGRIEFSRRGAKLDSETAVFELPDVYVKYVRHFAQWRALDRVGPGQDAELAKHFRLRFDVGVARIKKRMTAICTHRTGAFGGKQMVRTRPPRPRLPWQYGRTVR